MSRISVDVSSARIPVLQVGYQGENEVTDVLFDISSWITEFGEGVAQLRVKRPGNSEEESYVLSLTITDGIAVWTVSDTDTFNKGNGKVQLSYLVGNIVKKAVIYPYKVGKSIVGADNPVDPFDSWIERSKAWAIGETLDGNAVPETDETHQNNAKYYAEQADILGSAQVVLATEKATLATVKANAAAESEANAAASEANAAASEAAVNGVSTQLTTRMTAIETEQSVQSARMDTFTSLPEGSTSGNAELADIRVGADGTTYDTAGNAVRGQISELKSDLTGYQTTNDNRFVTGANLFDKSTAKDGYYVSNTTGKLIQYDNWFTTYYISIIESETYAFLRKDGGLWQKPSGCYYAFYNNSKKFTHGGVTTAGGNIVAQSNDAYCVVSFYLTAKEVCMFGLTSELDGFIGTSQVIEQYYSAAKYVADPYKGLIDVFAEIANPYYSLRVVGDRISVTADSYKQGAFIRFDTLTVLGEDGFKSKSWSEFKADIANDPYMSIETAYDGTQDVLVLYPEYGIAYNYKTNTYHTRNIDYIKNLTQHETMLLYIDADSVPHGPFYTAWANNHTSGIRKYIRTIEAKETELLNFGDNFVFAFATDCHWYFDNTAYHNYTNEMVEELRDCIGFDCYINGGDSIYYGTKFKLNGVASMTEAFGVNHDNYVYCVGNHDYNGVSGETQNSSWMFDDNGIESLCMRKMKNIHRPDGARYYYRDFDEKKIRVIVLDTSDVDIQFDANGDLALYDPLTTFAVRQNQLEWLRTTALDCPSDDWGVIIVMHVGLYTAEDGFIDNNTLINRSYLIQLLSAYVDKSNYSYSDMDVAHGNYFAVSASGTFANSKGHLVGVWSGHAHADGYCNKDGFNAIQTECGYPDSASRVVGTIDEICVDCVCVDMTEKTITIKRFGSGSDRAYTFG